MMIADMMQRLVGPVSKGLAGRDTGPAQGGNADGFADFVAQQDDSQPDDLSLEQDLGAAEIQILDNSIAAAPAVTAVLSADSGLAVAANHALNQTVFAAAGGQVAPMDGSHQASFWGDLNVATAAQAMENGVAGAGSQAKGDIAFVAGRYTDADLPFGPHLSMPAASAVANPVANLDTIETQDVIPLMQGLSGSAGAQTQNNGAAMSLEGLLITPSPLGNPQTNAIAVQTPAVGLGTANTQSMAAVVAQAEILPPAGQGLGEEVPHQLGQRHLEGAAQPAPQPSPSAALGSAAAAQSPLAAQLAIFGAKVTGEKTDENFARLDQGLGPVMLRSAAAHSVAQPLGIAAAWLVQASALASADGAAAGGLQGQGDGDFILPDGALMGQRLGDSALAPLGTPFATGSAGASHAHSTPQSAVVANIAAQMLPLAQAAQGGPVELTLSPAELGALRFEIHQRGDQISIVLSAERPDTTDLLRRNGDQLLQDFKNAGFSGASLSFGQWGSRGQNASSAAFGTQDESASSAVSTQAETIFAAPRPLLDPSRSLNLRL